MFMIIIIGIVSIYFILSKLINSFEKYLYKKNLKSRIKNIKNQKNYQYSQKIIVRDREYYFETIFKKVKGKVKKFLNLKFEEYDGGSKQIYGDHYYISDIKKDGEDYQENDICFRCGKPVYWIERGKKEDPDNPGKYISLGNWECLIHKNTTYVENLGVD